MQFNSAEESTTQIKLHSNPPIPQPSEILSAHAHRTLAAPTCTPLLPVAPALVQQGEGGCFICPFNIFPLPQVVAEIYLLWASPRYSLQCMSALKCRNTCLEGGQRACFSFMETLLKVFSKIVSLENNNKKEARIIIAKQNPQSHFYLPSNVHKTWLI